MGLHLTPDILRATYALLVETLPFRRWKLPKPEEVEFRAIHIEDQGMCARKANGSFCLTVSPTHHKSLATALATLAHEMVHMRLDLLGVKAHHGSDFQRLADQVCQRHGFDRGQF